MLSCSYYNTEVTKLRELENRTQFSKQSVAAVFIYLPGSTPGREIVPFLPIFWTIFAGRNAFICPSIQSSFARDWSRSLLIARMTTLSLCQPAQTRLIPNSNCKLSTLPQSEMFSSHLCTRLLCKAVTGPGYSNRDPQNENRTWTKGVSKLWGFLFAEWLEWTRSDRSRNSEVLFILDCRKVGRQE